MKRLLLALVLLLAGGFTSTASAHHHGWGWGGGYGGYYGGWGGGYGGWGYGGYGGYGGWGGYFPYSYRGYGYGIGYGYSPVYSAYYNPYYYSPYYGGYYGGSYAPIYGTGYSSGYYYPSCQIGSSTVIVAVAKPKDQAALNDVAGNVVLPGLKPKDKAAANKAIVNAMQAPANVPKLLNPALAPDAGKLEQKPVFVPKDSLPLARSRARETMKIGDRYFGEQKYYEAVQKYRDASRTAPDLAEAHFRLAHAETALGRYAEAANAYRQALAANPDVARDGFRLNDLYGEDQIAKGSHLEAAAAAALQAPDDTSYLLVVGMFLRYDGEDARAVKFLRKAWEMGDIAPHLARYWEKENAKTLVAKDT